MADDLVDLWDVTVGSWPEDSGTSRYYPEGHQRRWTSRMREATAKPIVAVGRYTSPDLMAQVIASGEADLIGSARQAIADPFLPRKVAEGRLDEIRECTGSNVCILREETFNHIGCVQNATAGEEFRRGWHPETFTPAAGADRPVLDRRRRAGRHGMRGRAGQTRVQRRPPGRGGARDRRPAALDPAAADAGRLGPDHRLARGAAGQAAGRRGHHRAPAARGGRAGLRRRAGSDRHRVILAGGRGRSPATRADAGRRRRRCRTCSPRNRCARASARPGRRVVVYDTDGYYVAPGRRRAAGRRRATR